jgi:D-psicose/D-tagatose/L-ribulose 3-epimerase
VGEPNRRCPHKDSRLDWYAIGKALNEIDYDGYVVMEPFVLMGGQVGKDISIWRDMSMGKTPEQLDLDAKNSVEFLREAFKK